MLVLKENVTKHFLFDAQVDDAYSQTYLHVSFHSLVGTDEEFRPLQVSTFFNCSFSDLIDKIFYVTHFVNDNHYYEPGNVFLSNQEVHNKGQKCAETVFNQGLDIFC